MYVCFLIKILGLIIPKSRSNAVVVVGVVVVRVPIIVHVAHVIRVARVRGICNALPIIARAVFLVLGNNLFDKVSLLVHKFSPMKEGVVATLGNLREITANGYRGQKDFKGIYISYGKFKQPSP